MTDEETKKLADDLKRTSEEVMPIIKEIASKYMKEDLGLDNWGVDKEGNPVVLDYPYQYETDVTLKLKNRK